MEINFYRDNEQKAATVENYLFTDFFAEMMVGRRIQHNFKIYQVTHMTWNDDARTLLNVFLWQYPDNFRFAPETPENDEQL